MLQQKMDVLVGEIENNLEQIKKKHPSIVRAPLKSEKLTPSRPVDLLEVYCEPNSQLTQQVTKLGGCALRFTIQDGDLRTSEGINKLWMWVHMYEPRNIWVAPECKFWGSFQGLIWVAVKKLKPPFFRVVKAMKFILIYVINYTFTK